MKKTKYFIGLVLMFTVVSLNIRHAWMNYGIAKEVEAATPSARGIICDTKPGFPKLHVHYEMIPQYRGDVTCKALEVIVWEKTEDNVTHTITITNDYVNGRISSADPEKDGFQRKSTETTYWDYVEYEYICGDYKENSCCYPRLAEHSCAILFNERSDFNIRVEKK